jgi:methylase of polypeptide subunit release factors
MSSAPAPGGDRAHIGRLAGFLRNAEFTAAGVREALQSEGDLLAKPHEIPVHLRRLERISDPLATLVALFVLDVTLDEADAERRLEPLGLGPFHELGLLESDGAEIRSAVRIIPHDQLLIASDRAREDTGPDHVAGVHRPSAGLAHLTVRRPAGRALDVGTGNGIQALLCAEHAETVVATDVNERALEFARFNAALNGVENVEFRAGSFFEPVAGERFDLVVCNPPYVVTPETEFLFRDGGMEGDEVSEHVARELPGVLAEGGFATMTASWVQSGVDPSARPRGWLEESGCDVWIVHTSVDDPLKTAAAWNRDAPPEELDERLDRWLAYYAERSIEAVAYGAFVFRRRSGANWIRSCVVPRSGINRAGPHLERLFAAQDLLAATSDETLATQRCRLHSDVRLEHVLRPGEDGWSLVEAELVLTDGLPFRAGLDEATSAVVRRLGPGRPLDAILVEAAADLGVDADRFRPAGVEFVKQLLELGYVVPAAAP